MLGIFFVTLSPTITEVENEDFGDYFFMAVFSTSMIIGGSSNMLFSRTLFFFWEGTWMFLVCLLVV